MIIFLCIHVHAEKASDKTTDSEVSPTRIIFTTAPASEQSVDNNVSDSNPAPSGKNFYLFTLEIVFAWQSNVLLMALLLMQCTTLMMKCHFSRCIYRYYYRYNYWSYRWCSNNYCHNYNYSARTH